VIERKIHIAIEQGGREVSTGTEKNKNFKRNMN